MRQPSPATSVQLKQVSGATATALSHWNLGGAPSFGVCSD